MAKVIFFIFLLISSTSSATDASAYIDDMLKQYAKLTEYEDEGSSIDIDAELNSEHSQEKLVFKTKYKRNGDFEFSWVEHPGDFEKKLGIKPREYSFWKNDSGIYTKYWHEEKVASYSDFTSALSSAAGVSDGLAFFVPRFLGANESCLPTLGAKFTEVVETTAKTVTIKLVIPNVYDIFITIDTNTNLLKGYEKHSVSTGSKQIIKFQHVKAK
jgi:hypothetical protein